MKKIVLRCLVLLICCMSFTLPLQAKEFPVDLVGEYAIVVDLDDNRTLFEKKSDERMYPASMTKVMTVYVALQYLHDLDQKITFTEEMFKGLWEANASVAGFYVNETVSVRDLLYGILLPSGADACRAISYTIAGSEEAFVDLMNEQAQKMGLTKTHFVNTSGLHDDNHYTTAQEMAKIVQTAIQDSFFLEMYKTQKYTTQPTKQHPHGLTFLANAHRYAINADIDDSLILGSKTGYTDEGGLCLSSITTINDMNVLMIVGNSGNNRENATHLKDTIKTYEYLKKQYEKVELDTNVLEEIDIEYYGKYPIQLDSGHQVIKPKESQVELIFKGQESYTAPIDKEEVLGNVEVRVDGEVIKTIPVETTEEIERNWGLFLLAMIWKCRYVILIVILFIIWKKQHKIKRFIKKAVR